MATPADRRKRLPLRLVRGLGLVGGEAECRVIMTRHSMLGSPAAPVRACPVEVGQETVLAGRPSPAA